MSCLALIVPGKASADDWWGRDKALHFSVSAALAGGGYALSAPLLEQPWQRALAASLFALSLGVGKEVWDLRHGGDASWKDLVWDGIGTGVGVSVALDVDLR